MKHGMNGLKCTTVYELHKISLCKFYEMLKFS